MSLLQKSAIKSVSFYIATPVQCCDRCSQGIKYVFAVAYKDGQVERYGSECINKILADAPTLKTLFAKNSKLLMKYQEYLTILSGPAEQMPRGREYFGSGLYFIADSSGKDIFVDHWFFHPVFDADKNAAGDRYVVEDPAKHVASCAYEINYILPKLRSEIARLEAFLAKVLAKAQVAA